MRTTHHHSAIRFYALPGYATIYSNTRKQSNLFRRVSWFDILVYLRERLPHFPYFFDSHGNKMPLEKLISPGHATVYDYIEYLQYGNRKIISVIDRLLSLPRPQIILLPSDHGLRRAEINTDNRYDFINLNALFLPGGNVSYPLPGTAFYDRVKSDMKEKQNGQIWMNWR